MQAINSGYLLRPTALASAAALFLSLAGASQAQTAAPAEDIPDDYYRAELVILKRKVAPEAVDEVMAGKTVEPTPQSQTALSVVDKNGLRRSDLDLAPENELHLKPAADRLTRSGNYEVLATAGWYEAFPPDYQGEPLRVAVGDWLPEAGQRAIEGYISIDRRRYLHVGVHLNHWQLAPVDQMSTSGESNNEAGTEGEHPAQQAQTANDGESAEAVTETGLISQKPAPLELVTWIRETRRMRSGEVHFIDSPTLGVLVYFEPIEE